MCSGVDWCTISVLLKPYLCNWSLRVCLTCGWSRFLLCSPLSLRCPSGKMSVHYQGLNVIWFLVECLTVSPYFLLLGRREIIILACLNWTTHYFFLTSRSPNCLGASREIIRSLAPTLKPEYLCAPRIFRILPLGQVCGNTFITVMQHSFRSPFDIDFTLVTWWYAILAPFRQYFSLNALMSVTAEHYLLNGISSSAPPTLTGLIDTCLGWPQTAIHCQTFSHMALYFLCT